MRVALFGATGATGRLVLQQLLEKQDNIVTVVVGDPSKLQAKSERVIVIEGDFGDPEKVGRAISGSDAVIDTLGVRANTKAEVQRLLAVTKTILTSMREHGVTRFIGVAGAGVDVPGDQKGTGYRLAALASKLTARHVVEEKQREFEMVSGSGVDWTIVRVPFISEGPLTRRFRTDLKNLPSSRISRADIAYALVCQLQDSEFSRKAPFVAT